MPVNFSPGSKKNHSKHARLPVQPPLPLDQHWRVRIPHLQAILSVSHTTLYKMIAEGVFPKPDGYDFPNRPKGKQGKPYWNSETVLSWLKKKP